MSQSRIEQTDPLIGTDWLGRYRLETFLGVGGWGTVYKAFDTTLQRPVAIKLLHRHLSSASDMVSRFEREAKIAAGLHHTNLAAVIDYGTEPSPFLVMEFVAGKPLDELLRDRGKLSLEESVAIASQICDALQLLHDSGVVHRDLKPSNIMVIDDGKQLQAKLLDFGLEKLSTTESGANLTATGETVGTPPYMSPELCKGAPVDGRSDLYSLGCILYEMLAGARCFEANLPMEYMYKHVNDDPAPLPAHAGLPKTLQTVMNKVLAKEAKDRFASATAFKEALVTAAGGKSVGIYIPASTTKRAMIGFGAIGGLIVLMLAELGGFSLYKNMKRAEQANLPPNKRPKALRHAYKRAAMQYFRMEQWSQAAAEFEKLIAARKNPDVDTANEMSLLSMCYLNMNDFDRAEETARKAIELRTQLEQSGLASPDERVQLKGLNKRLRMILKARKRQNQAQQQPDTEPLPSSNSNQSRDSSYEIG